ncbi:hypothetical protein [Actinopolyspora mortivallis]|uniref:Peptidase inhibitor family I36 n=1 Tax=Actinopolyspora mortivallis TaxID=33906 RepID=A0A2T0H048_ACTMO|nr:hypothetical protein [Actinopolyspora mortivallis]PRW64729.1 hypothetical protein CEP50_02500 [Actinopolyspora mortivallis]
MRRINKIVGCAAAAFSVLLGLPLVSAAPAQALSCPYPYVCLYDPDSGNRVGQFQDVTSGWQYITEDDYLFKNTRNDDVVYFLTGGGDVFCIPPNQDGWTQGSVKALRISWESECNVS